MIYPIMQNPTKTSFPFSSHSRNKPFSLLSSPDYSSHLTQAPSMATSLNPDAPIYISQHNFVPSPPLHFPAENPIPYLPYSPSYSSYPPFYIEVQTTHGLAICSYSPPLYSSYQYCSLPYYYVTHELFSPQCALTLPRCSIEELDENPGTDQKYDTPDEPIKSVPIGNSLVVNRRRIIAPKKEHDVVRAPRYQEQRRRGSVKVSHRYYAISAEADFEWEGKTTLMIKNLPSKFSKERMLSILHDHCIEENEKAKAYGDQAVLSEFDYFYLPIDFRTNSNFGFAFVNFTNAIGAGRLYKHLNNHKWIAAGSNKVCEVNYARIQGLAASIEQADRMYFDASLPESFLPVHFDPPYNGFHKSVEILHGKRIM